MTLRYAARKAGASLPWFRRWTSSLEGIFRKVDRNAGRFGTHLGHVSEATAAMQDAMKFMALGLGFNQYLRFQSLLPKAFVLDEETHDEEIAQSHEGRGMVPDQDEFTFCRQFLVTAALRVAEAEAHQIPPSWQR